MQSIGGSAQGLMNSLLFCIFTKVVRTRLLHWLQVFACCACCKKRMVKEYLMQPSTSHCGTTGNTAFEETTQYGQEDAVCNDGLEGSLRQSSINSRSKFTSSFVGERKGNESSKSRLLSDSLNGFKYQSLSLGKSTEPE